MTANRWLALWRFLSLDRVRPFLPALWLNIPDPETFQAGVRNLLAPYLTPDAYFAHAGRIQRHAMYWLRDAYGPSAIPALRAWSDHIFIDGGPDRKREFHWQLLASLMWRPEYGVPEWLRTRMLRLRDLRHSLEVTMEERLEAQKGGPLSPWDSRFTGVAYPDDSAHSADTTISLIGTTNCFLRGWRETCGTLSEPELAIVLEWGRRTATAYGLDWQDVTEPGTWDADLGDLIDAGMKGGILFSRLTGA